MKKSWFTLAQLIFGSALLAGLFQAGLLHAASPVGSAFIYQGRLINGGVSANGLFDLRFNLFDAASGGSAIGSTLDSAGTPVSNGLFAASLDFGTNAFNGDARWLEILVRTNGGPAFTTLTPRQPLTATPYAVRASTVAAGAIQGTISDNALSANIARLNLGQVFAGSLNLSNVANQFAGNGAGLVGLNASNLVSGTVADGRLSANVALLNRTSQVFTGTNIFNGRVGIGVSQPAADLEIANSSAAGPRLRLRGNGGGGATATLDLATYDPGTNAPSARIQATDNNWSSDLDVLTKNAGANENPLVSRVRISTDGSVGIGTNNPLSKLAVVGDIRLGSAAELFVPGGQENLRIVRGVVLADGTIASGTGFTVTHNGTGSYSITLTPGFSNYPAVIVTALTNAGDNSSANNLAFNSFDALFFHLGTASQPAGFTFVAIGPR